MTTTQTLTELYVHESGSPGAPAIVFLHPTAANGGMWEQHMGRLAGYHCLAPDLPGHGRSNQLPWISLDDTARQVAGLIEDRVPARRTHVVGLSLGGALVHKQNRFSREELSVSCPILLVAGEREPGTIRASNAALAALMPNVVARFVPGAGHAWLAADPELHVRMAQAWISGQALPAELAPETTPWPSSQVQRLPDAR
jgi:pimeloyl-ACP methyl ester carboxylesterase